MAIRIVDERDARKLVAQQTGTYVSADGTDRRYVKAGSTLYGAYRYEGPFDPQARRLPIPAEPKAGK